MQKMGNLAWMHLSVSSLCVDLSKLEMFTD